MDRATVAVVGAGPAGATTALLLARQGVDVLLLDRAPFPRAKPCGDCLSAAATGLLATLGLLDRVLGAGADTLHRWDIVALDGTVATGRLSGQPALSLERARLDAALLEAAREAGVRVRRTHVTGLSRTGGAGGRVTGVMHRPGPGDGAGDPGGDRDRIDAALVVGADGLRSVVARRLGRVRRPPRLRKLSFTAHLPTPGSWPGHGEMHRVPDGCLGLAPAGRGRCNMTLVIDTAAAGSLKALGPAAFFRQRVLERVRTLRSIVSGAALAELPACAAARLDRLGDDDLHASGPFDVPVRDPRAPGAALVGDAAGYYDPFTGQGIYRALAGARALAEAVAEAIRSSPGARDESFDRALDHALDRYARAHRRLTAPTRRVQKGIEWVLRRPVVANRALARLARSPVAMDRLIEVTGDLRRPASLLSPAVLSSLVVPPIRRFD